MQGWVPLPNITSGKPEKKGDGPELDLEEFFWGGRVAKNKRRML